MKLKHFEMALAVRQFAYLLLWMGIGTILLVGNPWMSVGVQALPAGNGPTESAKEVVDRILKRAPIIDGHNDLPWNFRKLDLNDLSRADLKTDLRKNPAWGNYNMSFTDIPRMRQGGFGGQFWAAYTDCDTQLKDSVEQTLEQIDVIKRMSDLYSDDFQFATSVADIKDAMSKGKIASLIGVEGGHSIQSNYGILRSLYELGGRYMTLTHSCNTPWADSSPVDKESPNNIPSEHNGLSEFGLGVIDEMNRLGMMVDLSHVSAQTMRAALKRSKAPVIFSHSGARAISNHHRNVPDDVLEMVKSTNSIVMINFFSGYLVLGRNATMDDVVAHAEHIRKIAGPDSLGIGGDYDGVDIFPPGLEDVSKIRYLLETLWATGKWTEEELEKMASKNILRVFSQVEEVRDTLKKQHPQQGVLRVGRYYKLNSVTSDFF